MSYSETKKSKYISFTKHFLEGRKTPIIELTNNFNGTFLGQIRWWGAWRKYVFMPEPELIFDSGCLTEIAEYIKNEL